MNPHSTYANLRDEERAGLDPHKPGDPHEYDLTCKVCGQPGVIRLTIDPQYDQEAHLSYEALLGSLAEATTLERERIKGNMDALWSADFIDEEEYDRMIECLGSLRPDITGPTQEEML